MQRFGIADQFEIGVDYYYISFKDDPDYLQYGPSYKSGADVYFWVKGRNLFEMNGRGETYTFRGDVDVLVEFFSNNLIYHITDDPFPVETEATNGWDMMDGTRLVEGPDNDIQKYAYVDWDNIDMKERRKIDGWNFRHGLLTNNGGFFLPDGYFRKVDNKVEFSWQNNWPNKGVNGESYFRYTKGVDYIDIKLFKDTIVAFCLDYMDRFKYKRLEKDRAELQKAIDIAV